MSGYILCQMKRAKIPYYIENISINIYSIEELCYYMYHNICLLDETIINEQLLVWLRDELHLRRLYQRLYPLLDERNSIGEFILPIFKEINYLSHDQFRKMNERLKQFEEQPQPVKSKQKGDYLAEHEKYINAIRVYQEALEESEGTTLGGQFQGSIYNNMGCAYAGLFQMEEALECFRRAYHALDSRTALKSYLFAVCMSRGREAYEKKAQELNVDAETKKEMDTQMAEARNVELPEHVEETIAEWTREYHRNTGL